MAQARQWEALGLHEQLKEMSRISTRKRRSCNDETRAWWSASGPEALRPLWLLSPNRDLIPRADEIIQFADAHLTGNVRDKMKGAMGESMFVVAAARLLPAAEPFRDRLRPTLDLIWKALNRNDIESALLALSELTGLNARAYQMLDDVPQPPADGRPHGSGFDDQEFVEEHLDRTAKRERPEAIKVDISQRMPGGGTPESKGKRLERAVKAYRNSLPSSPRM